MRVGASKLAAVVFSVALLCGCGIGRAPVTPIPGPQTAAPAISTAAAKNGAVIVSLSTTTAGANIYYTVDGATPTTSSQVYQGPFLVASNLTVKAIAVRSGNQSSLSSRSFAPNIPSGTLVWSDEFTNTTGANAQPDPHVWTYDTGNGGFGNNELEYYCAWGSTAGPCSTARPSAYVGTDGFLHIVAQKVSRGTYTSARLNSLGLFSFQYGRFEVRARVPEAQGLWPAAWLEGNNTNTVDWPACGEMDVLERVNAAKTPDWNEGSIHGIGFTGSSGLGTVVNFPAGQTAAGWHTYGMIWSKGSVAYYIDDPAHPYVTYTTDNMKSLRGAVWPFDAGQSNFILLNLAVGGGWPGAPNAGTPFPSEMQVDYVRVYTN
jgi:beta-glucanase (GH16 family)